MTLDDLDEVPSSTVANNTGGAERLDSDGIDDSQSSLIDSLLDEAEKSNSEEFSRDVSTPEVEAPKVETPAPVAHEAANEVVTQPVVEQPKFDPEIEAIEAPRNLSEKNQNNWRKLQETADTYKRQTALLQEQLQQTAAQNPQVPADYEELRAFRATFDIKNDPDFQSKFDKPIAATTENLYGMLKKMGASDEQVSDIKALGGPDKVDQSWWQSVLAKAPFLEGEKIKAGLLSINELREKQQQEIEDAGKNAEQFFAQKEEKSREWYSSEVSAIEKTLDNITKEIPWARFKQADAGATAEQLAQIQKHNSSVQGLREKFSSALWPQTAEHRASIAAAATFSHVLTEQLRQEQSSRISLETELKKATEELSRLKSASKVPRTNTAMTSSTKPQNGNRVALSASDAFDLGIEEAGG